MEGHSGSEASVILIELKDYLLSEKEIDVVHAVELWRRCKEFDRRAWTDEENVAYFHCSVAILSLL